MQNRNQNSQLTLILLLFRVELSFIHSFDNMMVMMMMILACCWQTKDSSSFSCTSIWMFTYSYYVEENTQYLFVTPPILIIPYKWLEWFQIYLEASISPVTIGLPIWKYCSYYPYPSNVFIPVIAPRLILISEYRNNLSKKFNKLHQNFANIYFIYWLIGKPI